MREVNTKNIFLCTSQSLTKVRQEIVTKLSWQEKEEFKYIEILTSFGEKYRSKIEAILNKFNVEEKMIYHVILHNLKI